jgi:DNA-binding NtrC family response regulator
MANILVVDDELGIRDLLSEILFDEGHQVELAENAAMAREARLRVRPDLVLLDIWMPDTDGVSLLKEWATAGLLNMPVIMMSGHATIDTAVDAAVHTTAPLASAVVDCQVVSSVLAVHQSFDLDRPLREARDAFEKAYFEFHLTQEAGSMTKVAEKTGLERTHLYRKLKQLGVDLSRSKRLG